MRSRAFFAVLFACALAPAVASVQGANAQTSTPAPIPTPIVYHNTQYGFCFLLPADWKGYTIVTEKWHGTMLDGPNAGKQTESGPQLLIRNPRWTEADPWQDIPIMVFTPRQWKLAGGVNAEMAVSAAPIGPAELAGNKHFVFALPPRWIGFTDAKGQDEVQSLIDQRSLEAPCGHKSVQSAGNLP